MQIWQVLTFFTLRSFKITTLSWAAQLNLCTELRAAQGHHRLPNTRVKKYGRDDVWLQLLCQTKLLKKGVPRVAPTCAFKPGPVRMVVTRR